MSGGGSVPSVTGFETVAAQPPQPAGGAARRTQQATLRFRPQEDARPGRVGHARVMTATIERTTIDLPAGTVHYRAHGPEDGRPVVFVHGFLVDDTLWMDVPERLAERGLPDLRADLAARRAPDGDARGRRAVAARRGPGGAELPRGAARSRTCCSWAPTPAAGSASCCSTRTRAGSAGWCSPTATRSRPSRRSRSTCCSGSPGARARARRCSSATRSVAGAQQQARLRLAGPPLARARGEPALGRAVPLRPGRTPRRGVVHEGVDRRRAGRLAALAQPVREAGAAGLGAGGPVLQARAGQAAARHLPRRDAGGVPRRADVRLARPAGEAGRDDPGVGGARARPARRGRRRTAPSAARRRWCAPAPAWWRPRSPTRPPAARRARRSRRRAGTGPAPRRTR